MRPKKSAAIVERGERKFLIILHLSFWFPFDFRVEILHINKYVAIVEANLSYPITFKIITA
jgi:hypothetical protein